MRGASRLSRTTLAFLAIFALVLGVLMPQYAVAQDDIAESLTTQHATEDEQSADATVEAPAAEEPKPEPAPLPADEVDAPELPAADEESDEEAAAEADEEAAEDEPRSRARRAVFDPLVADVPGTLEVGSSWANWRHTYTIGGPGTRQPNSAVRLDKLVYTYNYPGAGIGSYFWEQPHISSCGPLGNNNPNGACIGVIIGEPGDANYLNSFEQSPAKVGPGAGDNWAFQWNGNNIVLDLVSRRLAINLPDNFYVSPGTKVTIVYG